MMKQELFERVAKERKENSRKHNEFFEKLQPAHRKAVDKIRKELFSEPSSELKMLFDGIVIVPGFHSNDKLSLGGLRYKFKTDAGTDLSVDIWHVYGDLFQISVSGKYEFGYLFKTKTRFKTLKLHLDFILNGVKFYKNS